MIDFSVTGACTNQGSSAVFSRLGRENRISRHRRIADYLAPLNSLKVLSSFIVAS